MTSFIIDACVISLLFITIWYCWRLNNKIVDLKNSEKDLNNLVKTFDVAIGKTHKNISDLKDMSSSTAAELQTYLEKANELVGDLSFMTETASKLADRLERGIIDSRNGKNQVVEKFKNEHLDNMISNLGSETATNENNRNGSDRESSSYSRTRKDLMAAIEKARKSA